MQTRTTPHTPDPRAVLLARLEALEPGDLRALVAAVLAARALVADPALDRVAMLLASVDPGESIGPTRH